VQRPDRRRGIQGARLRHDEVGFEVGPAFDRAVARMDAVEAGAGKVGRGQLSAPDQVHGFDGGEQIRRRHVCISSEASRARRS
jgi:hypothetical protein